MAITIEKLLEILGVTKEEALAAVVSQFSPVQPPTLTSNWRKLERYGMSAPPTSVVSELFRESKYSCEDCHRRSQLTLDHIDNDPTNHRKTNLRVVCRPCNRTKGKPERNVDHQVRLLSAAFDLWTASGKWPTNPEILELAGIEKMGAASYKVKWLRYVLENVRE